MAQKLDGLRNSADDVDPAAFLKSVRELSDKRDREDAERFRKLEEEVEQSRRARAARRAERAQSISPEKTVTPTPLDRNLPRALTNVGNTQDSLPLTPSSHTVHESRTGGWPTSNMEGKSSEQANVDEVPEFKGFGSVKRTSTASNSSPSPSAAKTSESNTTEPATSATSLARSGTLSWQQRPRPGGGRPLSFVGKEEGVHSTTTPIDKPEQSREQIAASLGTRDPSWFKQTPERGSGSAAYRKSKDEAFSSQGQTHGRRQLPGMSRESSVETESRGSPQISDSISRGGSTRESFVSTPTRYSSTSTSSTTKPDLKALISADEDQQRASPGYDQKPDANGQQGPPNRAFPMSSTQARLAGERPASPTKGVGGFVQSAMLKRSDSISKRSSGTSPSRPSSILSPRSGIDGLASSRSIPKLEPSPDPTDLDNQQSTKAVSSSRSDLAAFASPTQSPEKDPFVRPALPRHNRSKSVASNFSLADEDSTIRSPSSPSKRWSPNKSSWIESALTRPESPKPVMSKNSQPSWMADLAKAKAQRASTDVTPELDVKNTGNEKSRPEMLTKSTSFGTGLTKRSETPNAFIASGVNAPTPSVKPVLDTDKFGVSPASSAAVSKPAAVSESTAVPSLDTVNPSKSIQTEVEDQAVPSASATTYQSSSGTVLEPRKVGATLATQLTPVKSNMSDMIEGKKIDPAPITKSKPDLAPKPTTDFRSNLKSRAMPQVKPKEEPEFLAKFGNLRKTQQEKYVAPDVLKDNILRGKSGLAATGGPVKTARKDELKESLLAKKDDIKKAKEEGRELPGAAHERKTSETLPKPSPKPEALAKRDLLSRTDSARTTSNAGSSRQATPEALTRHKTLTQVPPAESPSQAQAQKSHEMARFEPLAKQISAPAAVETRSTPETSKLAARFNPSLASILARGPPTASSSRTGSPATGSRPTTSTLEPTSEAPDSGATLQDVRKDRAKGPKRRKAGAKSESPAQASPTLAAKAISRAPTSGSLAPDRLTGASPSISPTSLSRNFSAPFRNDMKTADQLENGSGIEASSIKPKTKPQPLTGSAASAMMESLHKTAAQPESRSPVLSNFSKPRTPAKSPSLTQKTTPTVDTPTLTSETAVPEFKGFGKSSAVTEGKPVTSGNGDIVAQSAEVHNPPGPRSGLGITVQKYGKPSGLTPPSSAGLPPKPAKSSRSVSDNHPEASPNPRSTSIVPEQPTTDAGLQLLKCFGSVIRSKDALTIDTQEVLVSSSQTDSEPGRTLRKAVQVVRSDGTSQQVPTNEEYTLFDEAVYLCTHVSVNSKGVRSMQIFVWAGYRTRGVAVDAAQTIAQRTSRNNGPATVHTMRQGQETAAFLRALGGILITRRGSRDKARKQYMLCGRKHLGNIVFDEVDFGPNLLSSGFVYLISYHVRLQDTKLFLWKGSACSVDEVSAARLAAMDLSQTGEIIEVENGAEAPSFLRVFGPRTTHASLPKPTELWKHKAAGPKKFLTRLYRIQQVDVKPAGGLMNTLFRRPSWASLSPNNTGKTEAIKATAMPIEHFTQAAIDADGLYLFDTSYKLFILVGPMFASLQPQSLRDALFAQALLFASDYAILSASVEDRICIPKCQVVFSGVPGDVKVLFRQWDEGMGLWGTGGLMAGLGRGSPGGREVKVGLEQVIAEVFRT